MGDIGPERRRIEVLPTTEPVLPPPARPAPRPTPVPAPVTEPVKEPARARPGRLAAKREQGAASGTVRVALGDSGLLVPTHKGC